MATPLLQKWEFALQVEKQLQTQLKENRPLFDDVEHLVTQMRVACEGTIFLDFEYATKHGVETRLWDAHSSINNRYRKLLGHYRSGDQQKHVVERRKLEKRYADFIKTSQFFYKGYIQRLASQFAGMKGLRRIAHRLSLSTLSVDERVKVSAKIEHLVELSCHATLLRLGDLSRYRNELRVKDRSWDPALGYYGLASDLYPDSGSSHNQMAVIALADGNHLNALYHLYRAIAVKEPHPLAKKNLEIEFKKIITAWERGSHPNADSEATLILWFVRLHTKFYKGAEFSTHDELENEVLYRMALLLKEQSIKTTLEKVVLINIAAEYFAGERVKEQGMNASPQTIQSYYFFLGFNVRMLFLLLQLLQPEIEEPSTGEDLPNGIDKLQSNGTHDKITVIARRILPALRQYSTWLVSRALIIVAQVDKSAINVHIQEMWKMYADVLTRLANFFPVEDLPFVGYLLEEDETTVGFKPFRDPDLAPECSLYTDGYGLKPRITDPGIERNHPNIEMLARIRDILLCGLTLTVNPQYPIALSEDSRVFFYAEEGLPVSSPSKGYPVKSPSISYEAMQTNSNYKSSESAKLPNDEVMPDESVAESDSHQSMDTDMHRMVDSLLEPSKGGYTGSNETSYGMHSLTANEVFAPINQNGALHSFRQSTPKILPSLPGIWSSPFTPQPNELPATSPDRPTTARQVSPLQIATNKQQHAAAVTLDELTGYGKGRGNTQDIRNSGPISHSPSQQVNQVLQESLAQQCMPHSTSSSAFSHLSSLYANTPHAPNRYSGGTLNYGAYPSNNGNNTTVYAGASDFDTTTMLRNSIWDSSHPRWAGYIPTPPGGQGG